MRTCLPAVLCGVEWRGIPGAEDTGGWWTLHPHQLHRGPLTDHCTYYLVFVLRWVRGSILELSTNKLRIY